MFGDLLSFRRAWNCECKVLFEWSTFSRLIDEAIRMDISKTAVQWHYYGEFGMLIQPWWMESWFQWHKLGTASVLPWQKSGSSCPRRCSMMQLLPNSISMLRNAYLSLHFFFLYYYIIYVYIYICVYIYVVFFIQGKLHPLIVIFSSVSTTRHVG